MTAVRVLVVHSDPADLAVVASVVAAHRYELRVLESHGDLVVETLRFQPDAVVLDVVQRDRDGFALCAELKADPVASAFPVIMTGSVDISDAIRRAFAAGCDDFLEKPVNRYLLAQRLGSFAKLRRAWVRELAHQRGDDRLRRACRSFGAFIALGADDIAALERAAMRRDIAALVGELPRIAQVFRILDVFDRVSREEPPAEALEILRGDASLTGLSGELVAAFATWLGLTGTDA